MPKTTILPHPTMTIEEKNEMIAKASGWEWDKRGIWRNKSKGIWAVTLHNYFTDLNAMHEAEKTMNGIQQNDYTNKLGFPADDVSHAAWKTTHATASQRAEAFGLTLGLWT